MTENEKLAVERAREDYENDEVFVGEFPEIEKVDGGFWVTAKVFVSNGSIGIEE